MPPVISRTVPTSPTGRPQRLPSTPQESKQCSIRPTSRPLSGSPPELQHIPYITLTWAANSSSAWATIWSSIFGFHLDLHLRLHLRLHLDFYLGLHLDLQAGIHLSVESEAQREAKSETDLRAPWMPPGLAWRIQKIRTLKKMGTKMVPIFGTKMVPILRTKMVPRVRPCEPARILKHVEPFWFPK